MWFYVIRGLVDEMNKARVKILLLLNMERMKQSKVCEHDKMV